MTLNGHKIQGTFVINIEPISSDLGNVYDLLNRDNWIIEYQGSGNPVILEISGTVNNLIFIKNSVGILLGHIWRYVSNDGISFAVNYMTNCHVTRIYQRDEELETGIRELINYD